MRNSPPALPARVLICLCSLCVLCAFVVHSRAEDWSFWRGPLQTGFSPDTGLPDSWDPATGDNLIWKAPYGGRTTPVLLNNRVYFINDSGQGLTEQERVVCLDADTGKLVWEHKFNVFFTDIVSDRVGWSTLVGDPETGNVYAHGVQGLLFCFDKDGKVLWQHSLTEEYGRVSGYGGRVTSPVVDGDLVLMSMLNASWGEQARGGCRFVAFDKKTGQVRWWADTGGQPRDTYYSTPVVATINGERLVIGGGGDGGVHAFQVRTGKKAWSYFFGTAAVNCSPVVEGNFVYIAHGEENPEPGNTQMGRVVCLDASQVKDGQPKLEWKKDGLKIKFSSPILHDGRLYVCDDTARMFCLDAKKGNQLWRFSYGRNAMGSPVLADGKIYVGDVNGKFQILQPGPKACKRLHEQAFESTTGTAEVEINGSPAVANGRIYFMTSEEVYCIGKKGLKAEKITPPPQPQEGRPRDRQPTLVQIVPADVVLEPGQSVQLKARLYDADGLFMGEAQPKWELAAMLPPPPAPNAPPPPKGAQAPPPPPVLKGTITEDGVLTADKAVPGQFGNVLAKVSGLTGRCRVRVVPRLPYEQNFEKVPLERTPGGWVNAMGKFQVQQKGDTKVLTKLAVNASPLVARAHAFLAMPNLTDYTIQADCMGGKVRDDMPDMGIVANRYTLMLDGNKQKLRLLSWDALPRVDKTVPWPWQPNAWYRMKLTVEVHGDKALVKGKVWPADQKEPAEWSIEFEDPIGNKEGAPALYAYATGILDGQKGAEVYFDNVRVTPNHK